MQSPDMGVSPTCFDPEKMKVRLKVRASDGVNEDNDSKKNQPPRRVSIYPLHILNSIIGWLEPKLYYIKFLNALKNKQEYYL